MRKYFWAIGSLLQGVAALGIALAALTMEGAVAGWIILAYPAVLATACASCSASYKDVLARTVAKGARGTVSCTAGTVAVALVFAFAGLLAGGIIPLTVPAVSTAVAVAGALWITGALIFAGLDEPGDDRAKDQATTAILNPLRADRELRAYIVVRGLLTTTALAPPFIVLLSHANTDSSLGNLGLLMLVSSLAAIASSYVRGRLSDTSSRKTLMFSGILAAFALGRAASVGLITGTLGTVWMAPAFLFVAQIAYEGVRAERKTHLADMDTGGQKALYTALSNTIIGVLLLAGGIFGVIAHAFGPATVLVIFAVMSVAGTCAALRLSEVQNEKGAR